MGHDNSSNTSETVREILLKKHPPKQFPKRSALITAEPPNSDRISTHQILYDRIDGELIRSTALRMDGAAGPSGLDAAIETAFFICDTYVSKN